MSTFLQDLRFAFRTLRRTPGFAVVTALTLALGIGANTAVFTVINGVVLQPLPYSEPDQLVRVYQVHPEWTPEGGPISGPAFLDYRGMAGFEHIAAYYDYQPTGYTLTGHGLPQRITMLPVTANYFDVYRIQPEIGRRLLAEEETPGARSLVISHALWSRLFNQAPDAVGQSLVLDNESYQIVGIMPPGFLDVNAGAIDIWAPLDLDRAARETRGNHYLSVVGRLRSNVTTEAAQHELEVLSAAQAAEYGPHEGWTARIVPLHEDVVGTAENTLYILLGASTLVLLLACLNVANLFLARNVARERELATRSALGSGRRRLAQQLLTETILVAGIGGLLGVFVAYQTVPALLAMVPDPVPRMEAITPDARLVLFALGITVITGLLAGLAPVARFARPDLERMLRSGARGSTGGLQVGRMRSTLVVTQVTLGIMLCIGAGLMMRSFVNLQQVELGIASRQVTTLMVHLPVTRYDAERRIRFHRSLQERLEALNGIERVGAVSWLPVSGEFNSWGFRLEGREGWVGANFRIIEGHYFDAFGIRLLEGRTFAHSDDAESPLVTVVNQALVERDFAGREAIGQMILAEDRAWEIIGVVENVAHDHKGAVVPKVYLSHAQFGDDRNWALTQVISATRPWRDVVAQTRRELAAVDPELTLHNVRTMHTVMAGDIAREMFALVLMSVFGTVAILLVTVGIYGVLMYAVNERTREIGIRLALGASIGAVRGAVVRHGLTLTIIGIVIGLAGAAGLTRLLRSMLYGVGTLDPIVLVTVPVVIAIVAALAGYVPARRATRVDPMEALRQE